jgi:hypothetical protein
MRLSLLGTMIVLATLCLLVGIGCNGDFFPILEPEGELLRIDIINVPTGNLGSGQALAMTAVGVYSGMAKYPITSLATWSTDNSDIAWFPRRGLIYAIAPGIVNASCTYKGVVSNPFSFAVSGDKLPPDVAASDVGLKSIAVTPAWILVDANGTQQFTATATFSNGSQQVITGMVDWSVSDDVLGNIVDIFNERTYGEHDGLLYSTGLEGNTAVYCEYMGIHSNNATVILRNK